jgi:hypothetical protein
MAPSKRPIVDMYDTTWLGDPEGPDFQIEIDDEFIGFYRPSGETRIPWGDIASMDVDIPVASWRLALASHRFLSTMDALQVANTNGVNYQEDTRRGQKDIEVRLILRDGTEVRGWARKHQPLGYPKPEAEAATAVLIGRAGKPAAS